MLSYVLFVLWIVVGIIFIGYFIVHSLNYLDQMDTISGSAFGSSQWDVQMTYSYVTYMVLYLIITVFAFLLAYGTFFKKPWAWLTGIMLSSFLGFFAYVGIQAIGIYVIMDYWDNLFSTLYSSLTFISYIAMIIVVPCLLFVLLRPDIKAYFGKT